MEYIKTITLDVDPRGDIPYLRVKQQDAFSRFIKCVIKKNGTDYTPESGTQILFRCRKPDGHAVILDSLYEDPDEGRYFVVLNADGTVTVELTDQVTVVDGKCFCDLCMMKSGRILSSIPFILYVIPSPDVSNLAVSTDDFKLLAAALQQAQELERGIQQSTGMLTLSTSWTGTESPYQQSVTVTGYTVTANTRVDLTADATVMNAMIDGGISAIYIKNNYGVLTAYAVGNRPTTALTVQAFLYETQEI